jgi:Reverse transcriptase (RNA-dependent DNA polymerase)
MMKKAEFLGCLVRTAYFPRELPPSFTTKHFSEYCAKNFAVIASSAKDLAGLNTTYDTFTAPRNRNTRRNFAIVHPLGQLAVSIIITQNKSQIAKMISADAASFYRVTEDKTKQLAFEGLDFQGWKEDKNKLLSEYPVVLKADISRFFYTLYTHSIPWAIFGKEKAKKLYFAKDKKFLAHWSNQLDKALQSCQSRETFGIPVGPDTSRIIAELLLSGITKELGFPQTSLSLQSLRLVDDILIGYDNVDDAKRLLLEMRAKFWAYNLQLNDTKTMIVDSRTEFAENWEHEFDTLQIRRKDALRQSKDINRLLDYALSLSAKTNESSAAKIAAARIGRCKPFDENFSLALDSIFRLARDYSDCIGMLSEFLINSAAKIKLLNLEKRVERGLKRLVSFHSKRNHDYEVVWCLLSSSSYSIKWSTEDLNIDEGLPQPTTLAMLGLLNERNLLSFKFSSLNWRSKIKALGPMSNYWLPYYEAVRRKWTSDKTMVAAVNTHKILNGMLNANVTFLENNILNAASLNLRKRSFKPKTKIPFGWHSIIESNYE